MDQSKQNGTEQPSEELFTPADTDASRAVEYSKPPEKKEKKGWSKRNKILAIAGIAAAGIGSGVGGTLALGHGKDKPAKTPGIAASQSPGEVQPSLSAEAQKFVDTYGDRYADPVSTYYSEKAYIEKNYVSGLQDILGDEYVANFDSQEEQMPDGQSDMLGFKMYELPMNQKMDQAEFIKVFNEYFAGGMSNYMNLLSKNPSPEAVAVIDSEFEKFYSDTAQKDLPAEFTYDDEEIANLMDTCKQVVAKYGSAANYAVAPAVAYDYTDSQSGTVFKSLAVDTGHVKDQNGVDVQYFFTGNINMAIDVDVFKGDKATKVTDVLKNTQLTIWHQRDVQGLGNDRFTDISIGQRK